MLQNGDKYSGYRLEANNFAVGLTVVDVEVTMISEQVWVATQVINIML
jgi:hypothetical protein